MKNVCSNCEAENEMSSKYCSICGYKLPIVENHTIGTEIEQKKISTPEKKWNWKAALGFIVAFIAMFFITQSFFKPSIDKQLVQLANELNKNCPMSVDQYTTLKNAVPLPNNTLQYNYTLVEVTKAEIQIDTVKKYVFPGLLENAKTSPQLKYFRDNKVTLNYNYTDKNGVFVTEYTIKPEMYE